MSDGPSLEKFSVAKRIKSFAYAFAGIVLFMRTQHNGWIHALATVVVIMLGFWLEVSTTEWLFLVLAIGFVFTTEILNTALEFTIDFISPEHHPKAGMVKDLGAGAVLVAAITAAVVGGIIFGPKLWALIFLS